MSSKSRILSCCSRTVRAFEREARIGVVADLNEEAADSSAGREVSRSVERDVLMEERDVERAVVVWCKEMNVGYDEWVRVVNEDVKWCD
jgi:hypothetical protein